jgi:hypothetical protein
LVHNSYESTNLSSHPMPAGRCVISVPPVFGGRLHEVQQGQGESSQGDAAALLFMVAQSSLQQPSPACVHGLDIAGLANDTRGFRRAQQSDLLFEGGEIIQGPIPSQ